MTTKHHLGLAGAIVLALTTIGFAPPAAAQSGEEVTEEAIESEEPQMVLAPFTDYFTTRFETSADAMWARMKRLYIDGERGREQGYTVTPLEDDITAYLGGTLAVDPKNTSRPQVKIRVSAIDEKARLLALLIELENPAPVFVVHQVRPEGPDASIYQMIVQTQWPVVAGEGEEMTAKFVREKMMQAVAFHNKEVQDIVERERAEIEALD